jgi:hypothetical protein
VPKPLRFVSLARFCLSLAALASTSLALRDFAAAVASQRNHHSMLKSRGIGEAQRC